VLRLYRIQFDYSQDGNGKCCVPRESPCGEAIVIASSFESALKIAKTRKPPGAGKLLAVSQVPSQFSFICGVEGIAGNKFDSQ